MKISRLMRARIWWYDHTPPMPRLRWKREVVVWWCGLVHRHKPEGRMVTGVKVTDYSIMEGGFFSVRNEITDEYAYCQRCNKTLRITLRGGKRVNEKR